MATILKQKKTGVREGWFVRSIWFKKPTILPFPVDSELFLEIMALHNYVL